MGFNLDHLKFNQFKKEIEQKKEQEKVLRELNNAVATLEKKRDSYAQQAKEALRSGNSSRYQAMTALLKNSIFYLKQAQDMQANYIMAKDMCEMQMLSKKFVRSLDSIMKKVYDTCKAIRVSDTEKNFTKALYQQSKTSLELQQVLDANNIAFASSVSEISDISDEEIRDLLGEEIAADNADIDSSLDDLEKLWCGEVSSPEPAQIIAEGAPTAPAAGPAPTEPAPFVPEPAPFVPEVKPEPSAPAAPESAPVNEDKPSPEDFLLDDEGNDSGFIWDDIPTIGFDDVAGLDEVKKAVQIKVLLPLKNPEAFAGYEKKNGGGLCLYGPPGTGKTMIAAAIAKEIGAKFCSVKPSDLLRPGAGNTERAVKTLFKQARQFPCAVIYFDEMDSISPKNTRSQYAKQLRSEFLSQLQGIESYGKDTGNILFLICATNKPWDIDSAFLRHGRFGTKIYVGLPDQPAREYMINKRLSKIKAKGIVTVAEDINVSEVAEQTNGFNGADITNLLDHIEEISIFRAMTTGEKSIVKEDFETAIKDIHSSVQTDDLVKLKEWRSENDA